MPARTWMPCSSLLAAALLGCGGGSEPAPPKPAAPPPAKAVNQAAPAAGNAAAKKKSGTKKAAAPSSPYPGEDPADIFIAGTVGEPMEVAPAPQFRDEDRVLVELAPQGAPNQLTVALAVATATFPPNADFKLPSGFTGLKEFGYTKGGLPRRIKCDKDDSVMALVSGGGTKIGVDGGPEESGPQWDAFVEDYYMDVTEVTLAEFNKFRDEQKKERKRAPLAPLNDGDDPRMPALGVTWGDATVYLRWLGKEVPTEVEFEKAARGPDGFRTPWGNGREVWSAPRTPATIAPVGAFATDQSVYGIFDLAGNAREWTNDWFDPQAFQEVAGQTGKATRNWTGPKKATLSGHRVLKGNGPDWSAWHPLGRRDVGPFARRRLPRRAQDAAVKLACRNCGCPRHH